MAEETKEKSTQYFITVDWPDTPAQRRPVVIKQTKARTDAAGIPIPEQTIMLEPNPMGVYEVDPNRLGDDYDYTVAVMTKKVKEWNKPKQPKRLIGPFDNLTEALSAMHKERPKTDAESVAIERAGRVAAESEVSQLRAKIAELEKKVK